MAADGTAGLMSAFLRERRNRMVATLMGAAEDTFVSAPDAMLDTFRKRLIAEVDDEFDIFRDLYKADNTLAIRNDRALEAVMAVFDALPQIRAQASR